MIEVRLKDPTEDRVKYHVWFKVKDSNEVKLKDPIEIGVKDFDSYL